MFKLGCDPEIFLVDAAEALIASCGRIGGTKEFPRPLEDLGEGYAVQEDNVALEFNIPPASSREEWVKSLNIAVKRLEDEVKQQGLHFSTLSAALFPKEQLVDPQALEFGCDPDYNAWTNAGVNPKPKADDETLRSCGGHIHIGLDRCPNKEDACNLVKLMDKHASIPAVLMDRGFLRKKLYGKPGAFRPKTYGIEYRSLSNFWVFTDQLRGWAYDVTQRAISDWQNGRLVQEDEGQLILTAINTNDANLAKQLVKEHNLIVI